MRNQGGRRARKAQRRDGKKTARPRSSARGSVVRVFGPHFAFGGWAGTAAARGYADAEGSVPLHSVCEDDQDSDFADLLGRSNNIA